jgi:hypothetical protein
MPSSLEKKIDAELYYGARQRVFQLDELKCVNMM